MSEAETPLTIKNFPAPTAKSAIRLLLIVVLLMLLGAPLQALHLELGLILTQGLFILTPALIFWSYYRVDRASFARLKPLEGRYLPVIIMLAVSTWVLMLFLNGLFHQFLNGMGFKIMEQVPPPESLPRLLFYYLAIAVSAGICEEFLFRGTIMPALEENGVLPALLLSSLLFAFIHMSLVNLGGTFILGLIMGLLVLKTGSLWAGVIFHFINNFLSVSFMYLTTRYASDLFHFLISALLFLALIPAAGVFVYGLSRLQRLSKIPPLLQECPPRWPRGWFNWSTVLILLIFLAMAVVEVLTGFGIINIMV